MSDIIRERLKKMAKWAKDRKEGECKLGDDKYVRIGGNGFRAVSVAEDSPLTGFAQSSVEKWETVKHHFERVPSSIEGKKEERRLQAFMIRHALKNNKSLKDLIGTTINGENFDNILFSFDEISLGDKKHPIKFSNGENGIIRCDLLCVVKKGGQGYPLLIELKYARHLGRLLEQLEEFSEQISQEYREDFERLLKSDVGFDVDCSKVYKMMIWPPSPRENQATKDMLGNSDVDVLVYETTATIENTHYLKKASFKEVHYE